MKLGQTIQRNAAQAAKGNVTKGIVRSVDIDHVTVMPKGSNKTIVARVVGDTDQIATGDEIDLIFSATEVVAMINSRGADEKYKLEQHAATHSGVGNDAISPEMIGAARAEHSHDIADIANFFPGSGSTGDMLKSIYDMDADGVVDCARGVKMLSAADGDLLTQDMYLGLNGNNRIINIVATGKYPGVGEGSIFLKAQTPAEHASPSSNTLNIPARGDVTINGNKIFHAGNGGHNSGLDADMLDGVQASSYAYLYSTSGQPISTVGPIGANFYSQAAGAAGITFHRPNLYAVNFGLDTDNVLKIGGFSMGALSYKIWHEGNDGHTSGLDADKLDNYEASAFLLKSTYDANSDGALDYAANCHTVDGFLVGNALNQIPLNNTTWNDRLNADYLDNMHATTTATGTAVVARDGNGDMWARYGNFTYLNMSHAVSGSVTDSIFYSSGDDYVRKNDRAGMRASLRIGQGSAMPGTKATGDQFFRTDLGMWVYWDGTRWLTCHEYSIPLPMVTNQPANGSGSYVPLRSDYAPYFTKCSLITYVGGTNNGSNFWYVEAQGLNLTQVSGTDAYIIGTSSDAVNTWVRHEGVSNAILTYKDLLRLTFSKSGAPGNLNASGNAFYRLIIT